MDDELDQLIDGLDEPAAEAAEPDEADSAADADLADGQDEAEAADDDAGDAADAEPDDAEPDELSQLRARLEAVEAERATERAQQETLARQAAAAKAEADLADSERRWDAHFSAREQQAWTEAQQTYNPPEAYRQAMAQIIAERDAKKTEFANYRAGLYKTAYERSQVPAYVEYLTGELALDDLSKAQLLELAADGVHPDSVRVFALSLKKRADLQTQEQRAAKAVALKKTTAKPGGGSPHRKKPQDLDSYLDSLFG